MTSEVKGVPMLTGRLHINVRLTLESLKYLSLTTNPLEMTFKDVFVQNRRSWASEFALHLYEKFLYIKVKLMYNFLCFSFNFCFYFVNKVVYTK